MAKKKEESTALVAHTPRTMLEKVRERIGLIEAQGGGSWKTSGQFAYSLGKGAPVLDIKNTNDVGAMLSALGFLMEKNRQYMAAADALEWAEVPAFSWLNYTLEEWVNDFKLRKFMMTMGDELNRLRQTEAELRKMFSQEEKLAEIAAKFGL